MKLSKSAAKIGEGGDLQFAQTQEYGSKIDSGGLGNQSTRILVHLMEIFSINLES